MRQRIMPKISATLGPANHVKKNGVKIKYYLSKVLVIYIIHVMYKNKENKINKHEHKQHKQKQTQTQTQKQTQK